MILELRIGDSGCAKASERDGGGGTADADLSVCDSAFRIFLYKAFLVDFDIPPHIVEVERMYDHKTRTQPIVILITFQQFSSDRKYHCKRSWLGSITGMENENCFYMAGTELG